MKKNNHEYWGKLMALWVKSCTDKQPIMFYKSCKENLNFLSESEVRQMVDNNRELFWPISKQILKGYKDHYRKHLDKFPEILISENEESNHAIDRLDINSAFTSQFRRLPDEDRSPNDIREWGMNYIEKKWNFEVKSKEERDRFWGSMIIPAIAIIATAVVSILTIILGK